MERVTGGRGTCNYLFQVNRNIAPDDLACTLELPLQLLCLLLLKMLIWVVSSCIDTRGGAIPPGKFRVAVRFSVTSNTSSRIRGISKEN